MKFSIYLHREIKETLQAFGDLSTVVNKILELGENGAFDLTDKPSSPDRGDAGRVTIDVTNEYYLSLLDNYTPNSPRISLRRLLYWFVENEIYEELGWEYNEFSKEKYICLNSINDTLKHLQKLIDIVDTEHKEYVQNAINSLKSLEGVINDTQRNN